VVGTDALVRWLRSPVSVYTSRTIVGVEVLPDATTEGDTK
jgi:hypothetical protein